MNLAIHAEYYVDTMVMISIGLGLVALVLINSRYLPANILIFIGIVLPALLGVYLVFAVRTEIRVFAEVLPLLLMSALMQPRTQQVTSDNLRNHALLQVFNVRNYSWN